MPAGSSKRVDIAFADVTVVDGLAPPQLNRLPPRAKMNGSAIAPRMTAVAVGEKVYLDHAVMESDRSPSVSTFIQAAIGVHKP